MVIFNSFLLFSFFLNKNHFLLFSIKVSGVAKPGELLAIMGSSGSGKTTLLDVLNFKNKLKIEGNIKINGQEIKSSKPLAFISGYVTQEDLFFETLTVKEHLTFHVSFVNTLSGIEIILLILRLCFV